MSKHYPAIAFTDAVRAVQHQHGSDAFYDRKRVSAGPAAPDPLTDDESTFLSERDGFYLATVGESGWPYVQFRGGPPGFIRTLDEHRIAWADFRGNLRVLALVWLGRRQTSSGARLFARAMAATTAVIYLGILIYGLFPPGLAWSVPLQLTDLATMVTIYALWSQRQWAYAFTYYWCLTLSIQDVISPVLRGPDFPSLEYLAFFAVHVLVVWAAIYLTWGRGMRPDWSDYRRVVAGTLAWMAFTVTFNALAGTNYGFLNRKPETSSLLDVMGPWPWYLATAAAVASVVWALMTWPWVRTRSTGLGVSS